MEFYSIIFGGETLSYWLAYCLLFLFGVFFIYFIKTRNRKHRDESLNFGYWWADNWRKLMLIIMLMYLFVRGYSELYPYMKDIAFLKNDLSQAMGTILFGSLNQAVLNWIANKVPGVKFEGDIKKYKELKNQ